jgi:hypothetical protein
MLVHLNQKYIAKSLNLNSVGSTQFSLNPASEIKCNYFRMDIFAGTPFNKLFKFKTLGKSSNFWDPVFNNYDDIPSKLAQIYPNTSSIIQT